MRITVQMVIWVMTKMGMKMGMILRMMMVAVMKMKLKK